MKPRVSAQEFPTPSVLVVFPSDEHRILLLQAIVQAGMIPLLCESSDEAREAIKDENIQVVVCEDHLPESALRAILKQTRESAETHSFDCHIAYWRVGGVSHSLAAGRI